MAESTEPCKGCVGAVGWREAIAGFLLDAGSGPCRVLVVADGGEDNVGDATVAAVTEAVHSAEASQHRTRDVAISCTPASLAGCVGSASSCAPLLVVATAGRNIPPPLLLHHLAFLNDPPYTALTLPVAAVQPFLDLDGISQLSSSG